MTVPTSRKESLLSGSHTTTPEQQRAAGLYAADRLGEDREALAEVLEMLGLKDYPAARHGSAETARKRDWRKRQEAS